MATMAQVIANRANAQLSSGPKSAEGKAASSRNATRHGLSSAHFALMPNEDPAQFAELVQSLQAEFHPESDHERFLVDTMAKARWRILRIERLESEAFDDLFTDPDAPGGSPDAQLLNALQPNSNILDKLHRYSAAAERSYHKAHRELEAGRAQKSRVQNEANQFLLNELLGLEPPKKAPKAPVQNEPNPPRALAQTAAVNLRPHFEIIDAYDTEATDRRHHG